MKPFTIASFKYGLDTRREILASQPGTLMTAENLHITPGGEVEKRLAFGGRTLIATGAGAWFPFLLATDAGLTFFGGAAVASVTPAAGLVYQRLTHPAVTEGETYNAAIHAITAIKAMTTFDGKALVAATFADGNTFLFYDGTLVNQSRNGLVLTGLAGLDDLATQLAAEVNRLQDWTAIANRDKDGNAVNGSVIVKSPTDVYYAGIPTVSSVAGLLGNTPIDKDQPPVAAQRAKAFFRVILGINPASTIWLRAPSEPGSGDQAGIAGTTPMVVLATAALTVTALAALVNANTVYYGYSALADGDSLTIYAPEAYGASSNGDTLKVDLTGDVTTTASGATPPTGLILVLTPNPATLTTNNPYQAIKVTAGVSGGVGPYTYAWDVQGTANGTITFGSDRIYSSCYFKLNLGNPLVHRGGTYVQAFKCTVTDTASGATAVVASVTVTINLT